MQAEKNLNIQSENQLFLLISEGDEIAFKKLFQLYMPLVSAVVLRVVRNESAVPDLLQEVFLRIWLSRSKLPDIVKPRSWILQITYFQCFNWLRQQKLRSKSNEEIINGKGNVTNDNEEINLFRETTTYVRRAINELPPQAKKIYLLSRNEGMKIAEIADFLNLSNQTVKNSLSRSIKSIRDNLNRQGIFVPTFLLIYFLN